MGFEAKKAVKPLDWDFEPYAGSGTVPEPSFEEQDEFIADISHVFGFQPGTLTEDKIADVTRGLATKMAEEGNMQESTRAIMDAVYAAVAKFCKGSPSAEDLKALPPRVFFAFVGWLIGETNPLGQMPGANSTPTLADLRGGVSTS